MAANPAMLSELYDSYTKAAPKAANPAMPAAQPAQPAAQPGMLTTQAMPAATPAMPSAAQWTPGKDATVQGQLAGVLDAGGPLMDRATTRANQQMNARGLLNSSIAVGAGQSALYDAALPIASQDAQTFGRAGEVNARTAADFGLEGSRQAFQAGENTTDRTFRTGERVAIQAFETSRLQVQNDFTERMQALQETGMDARQAKQLATQEALTRLGESGVQNRFDAQQALQSGQFSFEQNAIDRRLIQQNDQKIKEMGYASELEKANVPTAFAANVSSATMNAINAISADGNLKPEPKLAAIQNVIDNGNATLRWASTTYKTAYPPIPGFVTPGATPTAPAAAAPAAAAPAAAAPAAAAPAAAAPAAAARSPYSEYISEYIYQNGENSGA